jgi:hypothetical protein
MKYLVLRCTPLTNAVWGGGCLVPRDVSNIRNLCQILPFSSLVRHQQTEIATELVHILKKWERNAPAKISYCVQKYYIMRHDVMYLDRSLPTFRRNILPTPTGLNNEQRKYLARRRLQNFLMMEAVYSSEKSANFYQTTRRHIPEGYTFYRHSCDNLKSNKYSVLTSKTFFKEYHVLGYNAV